MGLSAIGGGAALLGALGASQATGQSHRVGDSVEASPLMMNSHWEKCTVTGLLPRGDVSVACGPRKTEYVVQGKWVRAAAASAQGGAAAAAAPRQSPMPADKAAGLCQDAPRGLVGNKPQENGICRIGATVSDRQGRTGTVIDAPSASMCRVCFSDGTSNSYLTWMLSAGRPAPAAPRQGGQGGPSGNYQCYGGAAGNMRITIRGGRWNEFYAEALPDGKVGISSKPNGRPYYMVCERR
jgi:hypothetical protein